MDFTELPEQALLRSNSHRIATSAHPVGDAYVVAQHALDLPRSY